MENKLGTLECFFSIFWILLGLLNLGILNILIKNDNLFTFISLVSSTILIIIGLCIQEIIEKRSIERYKLNEKEEK